MKRYALIIALLLATMLPSVAVAQINVARKIIDNTRIKLAPDKRQIIYDIKASEKSNGKILVEGKVSEQFVRDSLLASLINESVDYIDNIYVYSSDRWALATMSVANLRTKPAHSAELASQALMGMPMRLLEKNGDWWLAQTPDGYIAWISTSSLSQKSNDEMRDWREADRLVVTSIFQTRCYSKPTANGVRDVVSDMVNGNIVTRVSDKIINGRINIKLPDGRIAWAEASDLTPISQWASQKFDADKILDMAYSMQGQPYLWGGTSTKSLDCSGLTKVCYLANGIILRRDASQQAQTGKRIKANDWRKCKPGDLLFFGNAETRRVTHVAIYDENGEYIHSSGRVKVNSVDPKSDKYLTTPFLHAVRINGYEGTVGIIRACDHPWYFNK